MATIPPNLLEPAVIAEFQTSEETAEAAKHLSGPGLASFTNGSTFKGCLAGGEVEGEGEFTWANGDRFEGTFINNKLDGQGKLAWESGANYEGSFKNGLRHGNGVFRYPSAGVEYVGEFANSKRHGQGKLTDGNQCEYEGVWVDGQKCGQGRMRYATGETYQGEWKNDLPNGKGVMCWTDKNERYDGEWKDGKQHGHGEYFWEEPSNAHSKSNDTSSPETESADPSAVATVRTLLPVTQVKNRYVGAWANGKRHGVGTFIYADGSRYHGDWVEGQKHGHGVYTYSDGRVYQGDFQFDKMTGKEPEPVNSHNIAFGSIGVELNIQDLVPGMGPKARRVVREVENVLLRWNPQLRSIFVKIRDSLSHLTPERQEQEETNLRAGQEHTITMWQFWTLCRACGVTDDCTITFGTVSRTLAQVRCVHGGGIREEASEKIYDIAQKILFREYIEAIVRLAFQKYASALPETSLALLVTKMINSNILLFEEASQEELEQVASVILQADALSQVPGAMGAFKACVKWDKQMNESVTLRGLFRTLKLGKVVDGQGIEISLPPPSARSAVGDVEPEEGVDQQDTEPAESGEQMEGTPSDDKVENDEQKSPRANLEEKVEAAEGEAEENEGESTLEEQALTAKLYLSSLEAHGAILSALFPPGLVPQHPFQSALWDIEVVPWELLHVCKSIADFLIQQNPVLQRLSQNEVVGVILKALETLQ